MLLFNPKQHQRSYADERSRTIMQKTIEFFESKGKKRLKADDFNRVWYADFLQFIKREGIFATLLTPPAYGGEDARWDTWRNCEFNEILGFYGLCYWYTWQVSILGLGPIWMSDNEAVKHKTAGLLKEGGIFAFGLSEKEHGADIYSTDMELAPKGDGTFLARGDKYYIGNGNAAALISTFGKRTDTGDYVFFAVSSKHESFACVQNVTASQSYVSEFILHEYPLTEADILSQGQAAWDAALNTVNVGKYNLGWASIGICTHAFYEAINHAANRRLYNMYVTDFPHVKQMFTEAYCRLVAMKLFALRAADYMRTASPEDRRYLLYNPIVKMKVTTQGEEVVNLLWDVIAAKGFEKDTYFEMAARDIRALPKLEGTVHVNIALILKFMPSYFGEPADLPTIPQCSDPVHDEFLFRQGPAKNLHHIRFHDHKPVFDRYDIPNLKLFKEQIKAFKVLLFKAPPSPAQTKDLDFILTLGELFTIIVYSQLMLENVETYGIEPELVDQMFDCFVRDFSKFALQLHSKPSSTEEQMELCLKMIRKPVVDEARYQKIWQEHVYALKGVYQMND
ncbi:MAG: acyl-CoA dehydrogenase [Blastocatellia bacterium]|nr:acyl-CoA dehydrogenase [Blastocatellia bacterium]